MGAFGRCCVPSVRVRPHVVAPVCAGVRDLHEVAGKPTIRKNPEDAEREFHASSSETCVQTRSGSRRAKQAGSTVSPCQRSASPR